MGIGVFVEFAASTAGLTGAFKSIDGEMDKMSAKGKTSLDQMSTAGKMAATAIGIGITAVVGESVKMGAEFEKSTNLLVTAAGESTKNLATVRQGILDIASSTGATWQNLSEGMYEVEKAGIRGADGLKVLKAAAQGAAEENADLSTVTNAMTSVMASYHLKASDSVEVMNAIKTAAGESKTSMENFAGSLSTVIPIASANNISFAEVGGALATLTQHGTSADEATQELSNTIRNLAAPNRVAQTEMQNLGLDVQDVSTGLGKRGLSGTIDVLVDAITSKMGPSGKVLLDSFNQSKTAAADANEMIAKMPKSVADLAKKFQDGTITTKEWRDALKALPPEQASLAQQFAVVQNKASGFNNLLRAGDPAAQTFTDALKKATGGATGLNTVLMLSGENTAGYNERIKAISKSMADGGKDVEGWESTQKLFNQRIAEARQSVDALGIKLGMALLPALEQAATAAADAARFFSQHTTTALALAGVIGGVLTVALAAYTVMMAKAAAETVVQVAKMLVAGEAWAAKQAASISETIALWAMYFAEWVAQTAASVATSVALWVAYAAQWVASTASSVASSLALWVMYAAQWVATQAASVAESVALWVAYGAQWLAQQAAAMATWVASTAASVAAWLAAQTVAFTQSIAAGAVWLAEHAAMAAGYIASNIAMAAAATAAFIAENAATLGLGAAIALLVTGIIYLATHWSQSWAAIQAAGEAAMGAVKAALNAVVGAVSSLAGKVAALASSFASSAASIGRAIIDGIVNGVKNGVGALENAVKGAASSALNAAKGALGIHSPSRVFRDEVGQWIPAGIADGINQNADAAKSAVTTMVTGLVPTSSVGVNLGVQASGVLTGAAGTPGTAAGGASDSLRASQHDETNERLAAVEAALKALGPQIGTAMVKASRQGVGAR